MGSESVCARSVSLVRATISPPLQPAPQAAGNADDPPHVSTPQPWDGGRLREEERGGGRPGGDERDGGRLGGEKGGQWLEGEELSEGEIPDALPVPRATNSLQMIADMYTDD